MRHITFKTLAITLINLLYAPLSWSEQNLDDSANNPYSWEVVKVIFSLILVLTIFYFLVNIFKKYMGISFKTNSAIRIAGGLSLGGKEKVVLIEAGNVNLLLGVTSTTITKLHQFTGEELLDSSLSDKNVSTVPSSLFKNQLDKILTNK